MFSQFPIYVDILDRFTVFVAGKEAGENGLMSIGRSRIRDHRFWSCSDWQRLFCTKGLLWFWRRIADWFLRGFWAAYFGKMIA